MSVFLIADIKVTDGGWVPAYAANVHKLVEKHGGKYLSCSGNIETMEGSDKDSTLIALIDRVALELPLDELSLRRLKKRRLGLRDLIARIEQACDPDELA